MEYNRYFWKSGRSQRRRNAEERRNLRKIAVTALLAVLAGVAAGAVLLVLAGL